MYQSRTFIYLSFILIFPTLSLASGHEAKQDQGSVVVLNMYYDIPGMEQEVLQTRLQASEIRQSLGLPGGRVLKRINDAQDLPTVMWEIEFPDIAAHDSDMDARAGSDAFADVRARMKKLIHRFERTLWRVKHPHATKPVLLKSAGLPANSLQSGNIVVTNWYFAAAGKNQAVLDQRIHASNVIIELGWPAGRVFARLTDTGFKQTGLLDVGKGREHMSRDGR